MGALCYRPRMIRPRCSSLHLAALVLAAAITRPSAAQTLAQIHPHEAAVGCIPASERAGAPFGCFIIGSNPIGQLGTEATFWHLDTYPATAAANEAKTAPGLVVEALGKVWLLTIGESGWRPSGGTHVATIGPLPVIAGGSYTAQFMEAVFKPGMKSSVHRHSGPEAWYTLSGETCLETPDGTQIGSGGGKHVIVPPGRPMELTATGSEVRRALVLILHDSSARPTSPASDWVPKGLCKG
jgi:quercetin dioxygenase-like cupin family protein